MRIKKFAAVLLSIVLLFGVTAFPAFAEEDWTYSRSELKPVANHLYEVEYDDWCPDKAEIIGECLKKLAFLDDISYENIDEKYITIAKEATKKYFEDVTDEEAFIRQINFESFKKYFTYENLITDDALKHIFGNEITPAKFVSFLVSLHTFDVAFDGDFSALKSVIDAIEAMPPYACTSCRTDDLYGRNFDWGYDDVDEYIMRVPAATGRHASIGVASGFFQPEVQKLIGMEDILPMLTMDGINDRGVAINVNVVVSSDISAMLGIEGYDLAYTSGTKNTPFDFEDDLCAGFVVRYILDNADSAANAVELLKQKDIYSIFTQEFHWMISDANATYIVECVNNKLVVLKDNNANHRAAMSNFHVSNSEHLGEYSVVQGQSQDTSDNYTKLPMGIERYEVVKERLSDVGTEEDMLANMRKAWYKEKIYGDNNTDFWSDMNLHKWPDDPSKVFIYDDHIVYGDNATEQRIKAFEENKEKLAKALEMEKQYGQRVVPGIQNGVIQTVHTSVYNLSQKTLMVNVQERKTSFCFALDETVHANRTGIFVNGDNVGLGVKCEESGKEWEFNRDTKELTLKHCDENAYQLTGEDADVTIIRAEHQWNDDFTIDIEPTKDTAGEKSIHCAKCGARKDITEIPPIGKISNTKTGIKYNDRDQWYRIFLLIIAAIALSGIVIYRVKKEN